MQRKTFQGKWEWWREFKQCYWMKDSKTIFKSILQIINLETLIEEIQSLWCEVKKQNFGERFVYWYLTSKIQIFDLTK